MRKKKLLIAAVFIGAISIASGCKKDEEEEPTPTVTKTNTEKLLGTYLMTAWTSNPGWYSITDVYAVTQDCYKDNSITYVADGTFTIDKGVSGVCGDSTIATSGAWAFNSDETEIIVNGSQVYTIITNDGTTLKYSTPFTDTIAKPNTNHTWTFTFTKQ